MDPISRLTDQELIAATARGEQAAFGELFARYRSRIYRFCLRFCKSEEVAEEITHDAFLKIWQQREGLEGITHFSTYLFTIAKNRSLNYLKAAARDEKLAASLIRRDEPAHNDTADLLEAKESQRLILEAIEQLSPQRKLIYQLSRVEGLNHEQIAERLELSKSTVNNHLVESLRQIKNYLRLHSPETLLLFAAMAALHR